MPLHPDAGVIVRTRVGAPISGLPEIGIRNAQIG
jgi:hypothetical protein